MDEQQRKEFGEYLKRLRIERRLSLRQVEQKVGISNSYLYQIERGDRNSPKPEIMQKLAALYDVSLASLNAAAMLSEPKDEALYHDHLENAFQMVCRDKDFMYGTHLPNGDLTVEAKRFVVEAYQKATGLNLLTIIKYPLKQEQK